MEKKTNWRAAKFIENFRQEGCNKTKEKEAQLKAWLWIMGLPLSNFPFMHIFSANAHQQEMSRGFSKDTWRDTCAEYIWAGVVDGTTPKARQAQQKQK